MVAFSSAVAAVRCAVDMQRATTGADGELALAWALTPASRCPTTRTSIGTPVIVAGRLCDAAGEGEILASEVVCQIVEPRVAELIRPRARCDCVASRTA